jgi:hypothetical protein
MDVLDMLDALEGRITAMRGEHKRLASALEEAERRLRRAKSQPAPRPKRAKRTGAAKKSRVKRKPPAAPVLDTESAEPKLGKRQALGRSLLEIRKARGA